MILSPRQRLRTRLALLALLTAAACGGGGSGKTGATSGDVAGGWLTTRWLASGAKVAQNEPIGPGMRVAAITGAGAAAVRTPGTLHADATYVVTGVPPGAFILEHELAPTTYPTFVVDAARASDLGRDVFGRPDPLLASASTPVTFSVTGLATTATSLRYLAPNTDSSWSRTTTGQATDTAVTDFASPRIPLVNAGEGDEVWAYQTVGADVTYAGTTYHVWTADRFAHLTGLTVLSGQAQTVPVALQPATGSGSLPVQLRVTQFATFDVEASPSVGAASQTFYVSAYPVSLHQGTAPSVSTSATLLTFTARTTDVDLGTRTYPRFLPGWTEYRATSRSQVVSVRAPGAATGAGLTVAQYRRDALPATGAIVPLVSPPRAPTLDGADAGMERLAVSVTPTLAWSAPALGTPDRYAVALYRISPSGSGTSLTQIARFVTAARSVTIPAGVLSAGQRYVAVITATDGAAWLPSAPRRNAYASTYGYAQAMTAPFQTAP